MLHAERNQFTQDSPVVLLAAILQVFKHESTSRLSNVIRCLSYRSCVVRKEESLRAASKKIDLMIKQFEQNYAVRDKQDVLAMCALQFASQTEQKQIDNAIDGEATIERLKKINAKLDQYLDK